MSIEPPRLEDGVVQSSEANMDEGKAEELLEGAEIPGITVVNAPTAGIQDVSTSSQPQDTILTKRKNQPGMASSIAGWEALW